MIILQDEVLSETVQCPYLPGVECAFEYFFASDLDEDELNSYLVIGWRKFGYYYFRPKCPDCALCIPTRVLAREFFPTKSQRRVYKKNIDIEVRFNDLTYTKEIYEIYCDHSINRFDKSENEMSRDEFIYNFYCQSCPSLQSEYYLDGKLVAVGFLDRSNEAISSIYFIYRTALKRRSLGIFSILREIEFANDINLKYYYLGYYVADNHFMSYKQRFKPFEYYDWDREIWVVS